MGKEAAHYATNYGWQVLPVRDKEPATDHGHLSASSDPETIGALFAAAGRVTGVGARMGARLDDRGQPIGPPIVAPEIDVKTGATVEDFYRIAGVRMGEYRTPTMRTGGGGWAMICWVPDDEAADYGDLHIAKGIEIQGSRKMRVLPPSVHPDSGKRYQWVPGLEPWSVDVAPVPALLLDKIRAKTAHKAHSGPTAAKPAQPGEYDAATVKAMLDVLKPWQDGYTWWLSILMSVHSALGDDGLELAETWADGKPGEVASKWATFDAAGGVTVRTLAHYAKQAGWEPPAAADEADIPQAWRITAEDWRTCPTCAALHVAPMTDHSVMAFHRWCRRPACPVYRKVKARQALRVIFSWPAVQTETVPAAAWRTWRKHANRLHGDNWRAVPLAGGDRLALWSVDSSGVPVDDVLHVAVGAILESEQARRAHRGKVAEAKAFLDALPLDEELDPETWRKMQEALDLVASSKPGGNVSRPRRKRSELAQEVQPPTPRAKPVDTILVCSMRQRRAIFDVLNRLNIPWQRRGYGGWRTDPLPPDQLVQLKTALAFGVPGARVLSGDLAAGSYAELSTPQPEPPTGKIYLNAPQALVDAHRSGRKVPRLERTALE